MVQFSCTAFCERAAQFTLAQAFVTILIKFAAFSLRESGGLQLIKNDF